MIGSKEYTGLLRRRLEARIQRYISLSRRLGRNTLTQAEDRRSQEVEGRAYPAGRQGNQEGGSQEVARQAYREARTAWAVSRYLQGHLNTPLDNMAQKQRHYWLTWRHHAHTTSCRRSSPRTERQLRGSQMNSRSTNDQDGDLRRSSCRHP